MMIGKRLLVMGILAAMIVSLAGCSNDKEADSVGKCTLLVECSVILDNMDKLDNQVRDYVPESGVVLEKTEADILEGDSVYHILKRELKKENILMEASFTGSSAYVEGIDNIYEFSCGELSGWMYSVNGEYPGKSCSEYYVEDGDNIEWHYTCDLGDDLK